MHELPTTNSMDDNLSIWLRKEFMKDRHFLLRIDDFLTIADSTDIDYEKDSFYDNVCSSCGKSAAVLICVGCSFYGKTTFLCSCINKVSVENDAFIFENCAEYHRRVERDTCKVHRQIRKIFLGKKN
jgi:hypothetical protein